MLTNNDKSLMDDSREQVSSQLCKEHYLLLLELYVKQASGDRLAKLNQMFFVPTSVHFGFLDFVNENDLKITPVDPLFQSAVRTIDDVEVFNVGKSVLFAVDSEAMMNRAVKMILKITAKKQMPDAIKPDVVVGAGELDLSGQYAALRIEMIQDWKSGIATSKEFDGEVPLIYNGNLSCNLDIFVRMSGFGQMIVTEFDDPVARDSSTFVFGTEETDRVLLYKCREVDSRIDLFEDSSGDLQSPITCPVCMPERYPCVPCGKLGAVEEGDRDVRRKEDDRIIERRLKDIPIKSFDQDKRDTSQLCGKPVVLKVSGLFENGDGIGKKKPTVTVASESVATKPGDPSDPDYDIFVLRIGKKGLVGVGEKSDIQLEMKTPKGPERRPPIRYETRDVQTEERDDDKEKIITPKEKKKIKKKK
ncbi:uncharacterized protein LOC105432739 [Pogonomyrmex barbatus]|uniref:Uncharacterized protein LOC105432739 n=1 Tax=Pogonomyrmex barbatus TaxID=144034 RepID=A0A6I9WU06_9HYME|nr:uncharacterized protein LOC105432739 [Pogonomyrmex barbatus]